MCSQADDPSMHDVWTTNSLHGAWLRDYQERRAASRPEQEDGSDGGRRRSNPARTPVPERTPLRTTPGAVQRRARRTG